MRVTMHVLPDASLLDACLLDSGLLIACMLNACLEVPSIWLSTCYRVLLLMHAYLSHACLEWLYVTVLDKNVLV